MDADASCGPALLLATLFPPISDEAGQQPNPVRQQHHLPDSQQVKDQASAFSTSKIMAVHHVSVTWSGLADSLHVRQWRRHEESSQGS